jgi:hypothetical protein
MHGFLILFYKNKLLVKTQLIFLIFKIYLS